MKTNSSIEWLGENPGEVAVKAAGQDIRVYFDIEERLSDSESEESAKGEPENPVRSWDAEMVRVSGHTYGSIVAAIVNDKYSADDVQALTANVMEANDPDSSLPDEKKAEYITEWAEFQAWRAKAKEVAAKAMTCLG